MFHSNCQSLRLLNSDRNWTCTAHFRYWGRMEYRAITETVSLSSHKFQVSHHT